MRPLVASELDDPAFGHNCIGCSPRNPKGLRLVFVPHGTEVRAAVRLDRAYESYPGMIHGGIIALILDEVTGRAALWSARRFVMTLGLRVRYAGIMQPDVEYVARAEVDDELRATGYLEDRTGRLIATASATFLAVSDDQLATLPDAARALAHQLAELGG